AFVSLRVKPAGEEGTRGSYPSLTLTFPPTPKPNGRADGRSPPSTADNPRRPPPQPPRPGTPTAPPDPRYATRPPTATSAKVWRIGPRSSASTSTVAYGGTCSAVSLGAGVRSGAAS